MLGPWYTCELRLSSEREAHLREEKPLNPQLFYFALSFAPSLPPPTLVLGAHTTIEHFFKNTSMRVITSEERWLVGSNGYRVSATRHFLSRFDWDGVTPAGLSAMPQKISSGGYSTCRVTKIQNKTLTSDTWITSMIPKMCAIDPACSKY